MDFNTSTKVKHQNNFIITQKDIEYIKLTVNLMEQTPENLREIAPDIRYIMVSRLDDHKLGDYLLSDRIFSGFEVVGEMRRSSGEVFGRLYRVKTVHGD